MSGTSSSNGASGPSSAYYVEKREYKLKPAGSGAAGAHGPSQFANLGGGSASRYDNPGSASKKSAGANNPASNYTAGGALRQPQQQTQSQGRGGDARLNSSRQGQDGSARYQPRREPASGSSTSSVKMQVFQPKIQIEPDKRV